MRTWGLMAQVAPRLEHRSRPCRCRSTELLITVSYQPVAHHQRPPASTAACPRSRVRRCSAGRNNTRSLCHDDKGNYAVDKPNHMDLIRFGGHLPKGGYDVPTDGTDTTVDIQIRR